MSLGRGPLLRAVQRALSLEGAPKLVEWMRFSVGGRACRGFASESELQAEESSAAGSLRDDGKEGEASSSGPGKGQWRKWIEVKLAERDKKGGPVAKLDTTKSPASSAEELLAAGQHVAESMDSVDEFERRVLGTVWRPENANDDILKELDAIDRASRGFGDASEPEFEDSVYEGEAGWVGDKEPVNLLGSRSLAAAEGYEIDPNEKPYQFRRDRLFFPGHRYNPEDLDSSRPQEDRASQRSRKVLESGEVLKKADFRNVRYLAWFISDTSRICPRRRSRISAKAQRRVVREIKTARSLGLMPFTSMGQLPFRFRRPESFEPPDSDY